MTDTKDRQTDGWAERLKNEKKNKEQQNYTQTISTDLGILERFLL